MQKNKAYVLLVEPYLKPKILHIEDSKQAIKEAVGGDFDDVYFPDDEITILYNKDGVKNNHTLNRVIRKTEIYEKEMSYSDLTSMFVKAENEGKHIAGYITFTQDSFDKEYPLESRTYIVSSNNKAFQSGMGGYSIYGSSVDKSDPFVRLERYMKDEHGGADGWKIERCYIREKTVLLDMIVADNFLVCYTPNEDNRLSDITQELVDKYFKEFEKPDKFYRTSDGSIAVVDKNSKSKDDFVR